MTLTNWSTDEAVTGALQRAQSPEIEDADTDDGVYPPLRAGGSYSFRHRRRGASGSLALEHEY